MKGNQQLFKEYRQAKESGHEAGEPHFDLLRFMEVYKRGIDSYNNYGLRKKVPAPI